MLFEYDKDEPMSVCEAAESTVILEALSIGKIDLRNPTTGARRRKTGMICPKLQDPPR